MGNHGGTAQGAGCTCENDVVDGDPIDKVLAAHCCEAARNEGLFEVNCDAVLESSNCNALLFDESLEPARSRLAHQHVNNPWMQRSVLTALDQRLATIESHKQMVGLLTSEIAAIEKQKQAAVSMEDYDEAKRCKGKIEALKENVQNIEDAIKTSSTNLFGNKPFVDASMSATDPSAEPLLASQAREETGPSTQAQRDATWALASDPSADYSQFHACGSSPPWVHAVPSRHAAMKNLSMGSRRSANSMNVHAGSFSSHPAL